MPITNSVAQGIIAAKGLDPSKFAVSDDGSQIIPISQGTQPDQLQQQADAMLKQMQQPAQTSKVQVAPSGQDSPLQTGVKSAINVAPSMIGSGIGAASGMELAGGLLDETGYGALLGIPLGLAGAYLGGKSVSKIQNAITPDSYKQDLQRSQDANPKAAEIGELATLPLGGFSPNPLNVVKGIGTAGKLISGLSAAPEEIANLGNVGIGGVIGGVQPLIQGDTSPSDILKSASEGALFNSPNRIGQRLGFKSVTPRSLATSGQSPDVTQANTANLLTHNAQDKDTTAANTELNYNTPTHVNEAAGIPLNPEQELAKRIETLNQFGKTVMLPNEEKLIQPESTTDGKGRLTGDETDRLKQLEGIPNEALTEQEVEEMHQLYHKYDTAETAPVLTEAGKVLQDYANSPEFKKKFPNADITQITPRFFNKWATEISALHGITDTANPELTTKGTAHIGANTTDIGPKADAGTMAHENAHHIMDALKISNPAAHKQLFDATADEYGQYEKERLAAGKAPLTGGQDEYLATQLGYKAITRLIRGPEDSNPLKQWWNDTKAQWKTKYGNTPSIADLYRASTYRLLNGISTIPKVAPNVVGVPKENQPENQLSDEGLGKQTEEHKNLRSLRLQEEKELGDYLKQNGILKRPVLFERGEVAFGIDKPPFTEKRVSLKSLSSDMQAKILRFAELDRQELSEAINKEPLGSRYKPFTKNQPESEGYIKNLEDKAQSKREYVKQRMAKLREVREAFGSTNPDKERQELLKKQRKEHNEQLGTRARGAMEGKPLGGRPLHTTLENRIPFKDEVTIDKTAPDGTVLKQGMLTTITKLVNKQINKVVALSSKNGKGIPFPKSSDRTDIVADVIKLMQQKGLDSDGLVPTISRRARTVMQERIQAARQEPKTTSLDKEVGEGSTAHDKMAAQKLEEGAEGDDTEGVSKEDIEELDKHFNPTKENTIKQEAIPTEASAKPKQEALADDLLWHLEDNWDTIPEERMDAAEKTKKYLEGQKGKTVDANEVAKMMRGEKNQEEGEGIVSLEEAFKPEGHDFENFAKANRDEDAELRSNKIEEQAKKLDWATRRPNERNQETNEGISSVQKHNLLWLQSELDSSRKKAGEAGEPVAKVLAKLIPYRDQMFGRGTAKILQLVGKTNQSDINKVHNLLMKSSIDKEDYRPLLTNNKQRDLWDSVRSSLLQKQQDRIKAGEKITDWTPIKEVNGVKTGGVKFQRDAQIDPFYYPSKLRANVLNDLIERTGNAKQYENELAKHLAEHGAGPEEIKEKIMALRNACDSSQKNETRFGASRIAQGMGLPVSLRDPDFAKTISYYFHKASTDAAWHDLVEKDPKITNLLDEKNPDNMIHPFQGIINQIKGEPYDKDSKIMGAMNRVATSFMLGPLTNIHIAGSTIFNPFQFTRIPELPQVYNTMLKNIGSYTQHALDNGYLIPNTTNLKSITDGNSTFIERLQGITGLIGKINGRVMSDKISKVYAQAFGEAVLPLRMASANGGEAASQKLMLQLDPDWVKGKTYTPEQMTQLASVFGGFIHGAHDYRTLPELMTRDTIFKPFVSLMSWSVSQTNQWMKHVWEPATKGNLQPLIMSTLGAVAGGYLIQQMRQEVSNKKSNIPTLSEIYNSGRGLEGNVGLLAYNFAQMASFTGMVGIGSSLGKMGFDMAYKNIPQSATFPLDEYVHNFGTSISEAVSAFLQKPDAANFFRIMPQMMLDIGKENAQAARIALNWAAAKGVASETENYKYNVSQADRDLRNYKMTEGLPYDQQVESLNNPYLNMEQKRFKRTTNIGEAASDMPEVLQTLIQRAKGNPDVLQSEMRSLKQNSYQTMPSPQNMPLQFAKYYQFLTKTYGPQIAAQRMQDYMHHEVANQAKASLVPTF